jgi:enterobactin synthetase component D
MCVSAEDAAASEIILPPQIRKAVLRRRAEFISGRLCARAALKALGATQLDVPIGADGSPLWPPGFVGSITHANGLAFAAVARMSQAQSLGLDVEKIMPPDTARMLAPILATADEYDRLLNSPWDKTLLTTTIFSAKEAIFKCLYPVIGRRFDFTDVEMTSIDGKNGTFTFSLGGSIARLVPQATSQSGRLALVDGLVHTGLLLPNAQPASRRKENGRFLKKAAQKLLLHWA